MRGFLASTLVNMRHSAEDTMGEIYPRPQSEGAGGRYEARYKVQAKLDRDVWIMLYQYCQKEEINYNEALRRVILEFFGKKPTTK